MIKKAFIFLLFSHVGLIVLQSCCNNQRGEITGAFTSGLYSIDNEQLAPADASGSALINKAFKWVLYVDYRRLAQTNINPIAVYATQPCDIETWVNKLDTNTFRIYFNQAFVHQSDTIAKNSDIISLIHFNNSQNELYEYEPISFEFDSTFMRNSTFDTAQVYTLHFEGLTNDGVSLADSVKIKFDLL